MAGTTRLIDKLVKAARLDPVRKDVELENGDVVTFYTTPLTAAERERAKKDARSDDPSQFAMQLLVRKALDSNGQRIFNPGDVAVLKNNVRDSDLQKLLLAVLGADDGEAEAEPLDIKSSD